MNLLIAICIGVLVSTGVYRILGQNKMDIVIGLILLSQGANLLILASGGLKHNAAALIEKGMDTTTLADPLPQALVLTAIVIGFGILAFLLSLTLRRSS